MPDRTASMPVDTYDQLVAKMLAVTLLRPVEVDRG